MKQCMSLSLTPPIEGAGVGLGVELLSPLQSRRSSMCDNINEVEPKTDRAEDLYWFTNDVVHT